MNISTIIQNLISSNILTREQRQINALNRIVEPGVVHQDTSYERYWRYLDGGEYEPIYLPIVKDGKTFCLTFLVFDGQQYCLVSNPDGKWPDQVSAAVGGGSAPVYQILWPIDGLPSSPAQLEEMGRKSLHEVCEMLVPVKYCERKYGNRVVIPQVDESTIRKDNYLLSAMLLALRISPSSSMCVDDRLYRGLCQHAQSFMDSPLPLLAPPPVPANGGDAFKAFKGKFIFTQEAAYIVDGRLDLNDRSQALTLWQKAKTLFALFQSGTTIHLVDPEQQIGLTIIPKGEEIHYAITNLRKDWPEGIKKRFGTDRQDFDLFKTRGQCSLDVERLAVLMLTLVFLHQKPAQRTLQMDHFCGLVTYNGELYASSLENKSALTTKLTAYSRGDALLIMASKMMVAFIDNGDDIAAYNELIETLNGNPSRALPVPPPIPRAAVLGPPPPPPMGEAVRSILEWAKQLKNWIYTDDALKEKEQQIQRLDPASQQLVVAVLSEIKLQNSRREHIASILARASTATQDEWDRDCAPVINRLTPQERRYFELYYGLKYKLAAFEQRMREEMARQELLRRQQEEERKRQEAEERRRREEAERIRQETLRREQEKQGFIQSFSGCYSAYGWYLNALNDKTVSEFEKLRDELTRLSQSSLRHEFGGWESFYDAVQSGLTLHYQIMDLRISDLSQQFHPYEVGIKTRESKERLDFLKLNLGKLQQQGYICHDPKWTAYCNLLQAQLFHQAFNHNVLWVNIISERSLQKLNSIRGWLANLLTNPLLFSVTSSIGLAIREYDERIRFHTQLEFFYDIQQNRWRIDFDGLSKTEYDKYSVELQNLIFSPECEQVKQGLGVELTNRRADILRWINFLEKGEFPSYEAVWRQRARAILDSLNFQTDRPGQLLNFNSWFFQRGLTLGAIFEIAKKENGFSLFILQNLNTLARINRQNLTTDQWMQISFCLELHNFYDIQTRQWRVSFNGLYQVEYDHYLTNLNKLFSDPVCTMVDPSLKAVLQRQIADIQNVLRESQLALTRVQSVRGMAELEQHIRTNLQIGRQLTLEARAHIEDMQRNLARLKDPNQRLDYRAAAWEAIHAFYPGDFVCEVISPCPKHITQIRQDKDFLAGLNPRSDQVGRLIAEHEGWILFLTEGVSSGETTEEYKKLILFIESASLLQNLTNLKAYGLTLRAFFSVLLNQRGEVKNISVDDLDRMFTLTPENSSENNLTQEQRDQIKGIRFRPSISPEMVEGFSYCRMGKTHIQFLFETKESADLFVHAIRADETLNRGLVTQDQGRNACWEVKDEKETKIADYGVRLSDEALSRYLTFLYPSVFGDEGALNLFRQSIKTLLQQDHAGSWLDNNPKDRRDLCIKLQRLMFGRVADPLECLLEIVHLCSCVKSGVFNRAKAFGDENKRNLEGLKEGLADSIRSRRRAGASSDVSARAALRATWSPASGSGGSSSGPLRQSHGQSPFNQ